MFFTIAALMFLANTMNLTSPMNYIIPTNFTTSTLISDSLNYTTKMFQSIPSFSSYPALSAFKMEPYRNEFFLFTERQRYDHSTLILLSYTSSFFLAAMLIYCLVPARRTQTVYIKAYTYESDEEDMDYTDSVFSRERSKSWKPHPMVRRSMVSSQNTR